MASATSGIRRHVQRNIPTEIITLPSHPRIESADDPFDDVNILGSGGRSPRDGSMSFSETRSSSPAETICSDLSESMRAASVWSATENYTTRSSAFSLHEDEFDRRESQKVKKLLESIESMLFEDGDDGPAHVFLECKEWISAFPHLRVVGTTVVPSQNPGYQLYSSPNPNVSSEPTSPLSITEFSNFDLAVHGLPISIGESPSRDGRLDSDKSCTSIEEDDEELITQDGVMEEYFAIDESFDEMSISENGPWWSIWVPMTPQECFRNDVVQAVFSKLWVEVVEMLHALIRQCWETAQNYKRSGRRLVAPAILRQPSTTSHHRSLLGISPHKSGRLNSTIGRSVSQVGFMKLDGLLSISTKALQTRDKTFINNETDPSSSGKSPLSSLTSLSGQMTVKVGERTPSARTRAVGRAKLAPILGIDPFKDEEQSQKSTLSNGFIRGIKMTTFADWQLPAVRPRTATNNPPGGPLPPIVREVSSENMGNSNYSNNNRRNLTHGHLHRLRTAVDERDKTQRGWRPHSTSVVYPSVDGRRATWSVSSRNSVPLTVVADSGSSRLTVTGSNAGYAHLTSTTPSSLPETDREFEQQDRLLNSTGRRHSMSYRQSNSGSHKNAEGAEVRRSSYSRYNPVVR